MQLVTEISHRPFIDDEHALTVALLTLLLFGKLALMYLDVVFLSQPSQCLHIGHLLVLHDEADGIASLSASEAMACAACRRHDEGRCLFVMERTQSLIVCSAAPQRYKLGHHVHNVGGVLDAFYGGAINHILSVSVFFLEHSPLLLALRCVLRIKS